MSAHVGVRAARSHASIALVLLATDDVATYGG